MTKKPTLTTKLKKCPRINKGSGLKMINIKSKYGGVESHIEGSTPVITAEAIAAKWLDRRRCWR